MLNKGVTLIELLIVIVVLGIITSFSVVSVTKIIDNTAQKADALNAEFVFDAIEQAFGDGVIIIRNNALYNTVTKRAYSGTGTWFYDDMIGYITNRIVPQYSEAKNTYNKDSTTYKFRFSVSGNNLTIYYFDTNRKKLNLFTSSLE